MTLLLAALLAAALPPARKAAEEHLRLETPHGVVHVWRPEGYEPDHAGVVVYVHGYGETADASWEQDALGEQFRASRRDALFVVPEAPARREEQVSWASLGELVSSLESAGVDVPKGPVVAVGHSGAYRTLVPWLREPSLQELVLLDAVYGYRETVVPLRSWLLHSRTRRLVLVAQETWRRCEQLVRGLRATRRDALPEDAAALSPKEKAARVVLYRSQYEHMGMVKDGHAIPLLLSATRVPELREAEAELRVRSTLHASR
jgi:hypothetical protein